MTPEIPQQVWKTPRSRVKTLHLATLVKYTGLPVTACLPACGPAAGSQTAFRCNGRTGSRRRGRSETERNEFLLAAAPALLAKNVNETFYFYFIIWQEANFYANVMKRSSPSLHFFIFCFSSSTIFLHLLFFFVYCSSIVLFRLLFFCIYRFSVFLHQFAVLYGEFTRASRANFSFIFDLLANVWNFSDSIIRQFYLLVIVCSNLARLDSV